MEDKPIDYYMKFNDNTREIAIYEFFEYSKFEEKINKFRSIKMGIYLIIYNFSDNLMVKDLNMDKNLRSLKYKLFS